MYDGSGVFVTLVFGALDLVCLLLVRRGNIVSEISPDGQDMGTPVRIQAFTALVIVT